MFCAIYSFKIKPSQDQAFKQAWKELTLLILKHEGSLGSRLHQQNETTFIGYAQWPSKTIWQNSGNNLPDAANTIRKTMRDACEKIETLYELDVVDDLLKK